MLIKLWKKKGTNKNDEVSTDEDEELCEYERIRISIIEERQQWINDSNILDEIKKSKTDFYEDKNKQQEKGN